MTALCAVIDYKSDKNCFLTLPENLFWSDEITVFEVQQEGKESVYCSCSGETTHSEPSGSKTAYLNGLYANKLGIDHGSAVILKRVPIVAECVSVFVEPLSVDDWEILEIHSQYVESHLLDQVRVIWSGQVLPVWVNASTCIFLKIGAIQPPAKCVLLVNNTEVIVDPKVRSGSAGGRAQGHTKIASQLPTPARNQQGFSEMPHETDQSNYRRLSSNQRTELVASAGVIQGLVGYMKSFFWFSEPVSSAKPGQIPKRDNSAVLSKSFKCGLRVQPLRVLQHEAELQCSTNVFVRYSDVNQKYLGPADRTSSKLPVVFYAKLSKLLSPDEKEEQKKIVELKDSDKRKGGNSHSNSPSNSTLNPISKTSSPKDLCAIVRVVAIETPGLCLDASYHGTVCEVLQQQPILQDHMIISDFLRRQLKLDVTGRVQLEGVCSPPEEICVITLFQISDLPHSITSDMIASAFKSWLHRTLTGDKSMVIFQQMLVKFPILPELYLEALMTFDSVRVDQSASSTHNYGIIYLNTCESLTVDVKERVSGRRNWPEITHSPCSDVSEFDPTVPTVLLENLGGVRELASKALTHIEMCFGQRPLTQAVFPSLIGLHTGVLLVTGDRGTGKSSLVKALCRRVADLPCLAYTTVLECKTLKGKRPETIQRLIEKTFDESSWRQPSVIVLDDVDVIAGISNDPDAERTGEAQYFYKISEVIRNIIKTEMINNPRLSVVFTSRSCTSVHPSLVSARGLHVVQETVEIKPPTKAEKKEILEAILQSKPSVNPECIDRLSLSDFSRRTEGFVAQDLRTVVDRAIHAHFMSDFTDDLSLRNEDFEAALKGFVPASLRNVTLHQETDVGWKDVGGLRDVKNTLVETLEWPTKYPQLFANCPLRLRSGLLLFGAPGTGKTLLARAVAKECGLNFISIKGPELLSKYIGASEQAVRDTFSRAQSARPCVLFFDEFDSIAPRRGHDSTGVTDRVVNQLLTQLDGVEGLEGVYVLGATSRPDLIDPALLRPGRLDKCLHCELPTSEERLEILTALSRKLNLAQDVDLTVVSSDCENFTGADFKALLYNAQLEAIHEMTSVVKGGSESSPLDDLEQRTAMVCKSVTSIQKSDLEPRQITPAGEESCALSIGESKLTYIPKLEEGPVKMEPETEKLLLKQVGKLEKRLKKLTHVRATPASVGDISPTQNGQSNSMIQVNQSHLLRAAKEMRPSVSAAERVKYEMIYSNFVKSRGGDFNSGAVPSGKRLTLA